VTTSIETAVDVVALMSMLLVAVVRAPLLVEAAVSVVSAGLVLLVGGLGWASARHEVGALIPVVGFLMAILVIAEGCRVEGLFDYLGSVLSTRASGSAYRLLNATFVVAALVTAALSLDATVVLLTPVVLVAARRSRLRARPSVTATAHLANTASTLLPVSNLTNLLALSASGVSFLGFVALMAPVWVSTIAVEYVVLRLYFRRDLVQPGGTPVTEHRPVPRIALVVVVATLGAFVLAGSVHIEEVWAAAAGAAVLAAVSIRSGRLGWSDLWRATNVTFALYVLCLGVVVTALADVGASSLLRHFVPASTGLAALLAIATLGLLAANLLNNLPATLLLLPLVTPLGTVAVLALLIGVNVGSNLTYVGSLANLLWRRALARDGVHPTVLDFHTPGLAVVVPSIATGVVVLWAWNRLVG
jgi:arsenical pump membrane protein